MDKQLAVEFARLRAKGYHAREAFRDAKINVRFAHLEREGLVRLRHEPDTEPYLMGDIEDEAATLERIEHNGVWGIVVDVCCPCCGAWKYVDAVWGFVGDDLQDNGYDADLKETAIEELAAMKERVLCAS